MASLPEDRLDRGCGRAVSGGVGAAGLPGGDAGRGGGLHWGRQQLRGDRLPLPGPQAAGGPGRGRKGGRKGPVFGWPGAKMGRAGWFLAPVLVVSVDRTAFRDGLGVLGVWRVFPKWGRLDRWNLEGGSWVVKWFQVS